MGAVECDEQALVALLVRHDVATLSVFGSVLRDDFSPQSDIDFIVSFSNSRDKSLFDLIGLQQDLEAFFHRPVDLIEEGSVVNPFRKEEISTSSRVIYAA